MNYPKQLMSITEMAELGFPITELKKAVHVKNQNFATMTAGKGKWLIDTEKFERWRMNK